MRAQLTIYAKRPTASDDVDRPGRSLPISALQLIAAQSGKIKKQDLAGFSISANQRQMLLTAYGCSVASM